MIPGEVIISLMIIMSVGFIWLLSFHFRNDAEPVTQLSFPGTDWMNDAEITEPPVSVKKSESQTISKPETTNSSTRQESSPVIYADDSGNVLRMSDLESSSEFASYDDLSYQNLSPSASHLIMQANEHRNKDHLSEAIQLYEEAIREAPEAPLPVYNLAQTYLNMGEIEQAQYYYELADRLSPKGFYDTKTALYTLKAEQEGDLIPGTYLSYQQIEWAASREQQVTIARDLVNHQVHFAPGWKVLANLLTDLDERQEAIVEGLSYPSDIDTYGNLMVNQALLWDMQGKHQEAIELLGELIFDPNMTVGIQNIAKFALGNILHV